MKPKVATILIACLFTGQVGSAQPPSTQSPAATQKITKITFCRDAESLIPDSARNSFSPVGAAFLKQIGKPYSGTSSDVKPYKVTLLKPSRNGVALLVDEASQHWDYAPTKGYTGPDQITFLVADQRKRYKVVVNFWVAEVLDDSRKRSDCESKNFTR